MLLRSLFVASVSSNRFLLLPSLSILDFLSKPGRSFLFDVERNPLLHSILKRTFYNQFCGGETIEETKACVRRLKDLGFRGIILTYAREIVFDHKTKTEHGHGSSQSSESPAEAASKLCPDIEAWRKGTLETMECINDGDFLALKLTGAGLLVTDAFTAGELPPPQMMEALREVCAACSERNIRVIIDAESQQYQGGIDRTTLELMRTFNRPRSGSSSGSAGPAPAAVYNTYQAYLKGTPRVVAEHLAAANRDGFTMGLKLVRGAYIFSEDRSLIHDTKQDTDDAYDAIAQGALRQHIGRFGNGNSSGEGKGEGENFSEPFPALNLLLASHNRASVLAAHRLHQQRAKLGLPTVPVAFGQLQGMSDEVSFSLLGSRDEAGVAPDVFKCTTWGSLNECIAYLLRRAVENRDAVLRTGDEYAALKTEAWRRFKSSFSRSG
ncbi:proline oxidase [Xylariales sp. PMI_506]|nr:proline oxidase [Xylariales sp. PMI_506]